MPGRNNFGEEFKIFDFAQGDLTLNDTLGDGGAEPLGRLKICGG